METRDEKGEIEIESMGGFFKKNILFLNDHSLKSLRRVQQELIDLARWNLAQPIMFKFSGVISKYTKSFNASQIFEAIFSKRLASGVDHSLVLETIDPI